MPSMGEVGHRREVHDLLDVALGEHGEAGLAAGHDVGVIAEDVEGVGGHGTGGHVEDARQALARDLVHVRDHEEQALGRRVGRLGRRVGRREGARAERAVDGARGAGLGLHLDDLDRRAKDVLHALSGPLVDVIGHGAGRGDRVDARHLGERIRDVRRRLVAVHGLKLARHILSFVPVPEDPHGPRQLSLTRHMTESGRWPMHVHSVLRPGDLYSRLRPPIGRGSRFCRKSSRITKRR